MSGIGYNPNRGKGGQFTSGGGGGDSGGGVGGGGSKSGAKPELKYKKVPGSHNIPPERHALYRELTDKGHDIKTLQETPVVQLRAMAAEAKGYDRFKTASNVTKTAARNYSTKSTVTKTANPPIGGQARGPSPFYLKYKAGRKR